MGILGSGLGVNGNNHHAKLEFPHIDGLNLNIWMYKAEQFFDLDHTQEGNKVKMVFVYFEGKAFDWYQSLMRTKERDKVISWCEFVEALFATFGERAFLDPIKKLK